MNRLKFVFIVFFSISQAAFLNAQNSNKEIILGTYFSPNKKSKIEFIKKDSLIQGVLIWNVNPEIKDKFNRNKELQSQKLIGQTIFKNLKYNNELSWKGKFYDTESGFTYNCNLWFESNKNKLKVRGYIDNPIIGKTKVLKRVIIQDPKKQ